MKVVHRTATEFVAVVLVSGLAMAVVATSVEAETPDAGDTVATAATAYGQTTITGTFTTGDDVDLYRICISNGATFSVTISGLGAGSNDGQLFLFDATGHGKAAVDDTGAGGLVPAFPAGNAVTSALPAGEYLLGISNFDRDPVSGGVEIFPSTVGVVAPNAGMGPLTGWNGASNANAMTTYTLNLTGVGCASPVMSAPPADITVPAISGAGTPVTYTVPTATDFLDQALAVSCVPASGSTFPIGATVVTCSATDIASMTTSVTFNVTVTNAAPSVTVPSNISVNATGPSGAVVTFTASGSDPEQGVLTPVCVPPSGSTFAIGTTPVTCTVTDFGGLQASSGFNVTVLASPAAITATKTATGAGSAGGTVTYTVVLSNSSAFGQMDNPGNEFTDVLPAQLALVSATATSGTAVATMGTNTVTWSGSIAANSSVTITLTATIVLGTAVGMPITHPGTIAYDADGNGTNEAVTLTDDPALPGGQNPTTFAVAAAVIPVLGPFGTALLALLVAAAGLAARPR